MKWNYPQLISHLTPTIQIVFQSTRNTLATKCVIIWTTKSINIVFVSVNVVNDLGKSPSKQSYLKLNFNIFGMFGVKEPLKQFIVHLNEADATNLNRQFNIFPKIISELKRWIWQLYSLSLFLLRAVYSVSISSMSFVSRNNHSYHFVP